MLRIIKILDENFERWLMFGFYTHVVAIVFIEVLRRFVFSYSSMWGEETARYTFIYLVWLGAAAAIKDRSHIRIDIIFELVSEKFKPYFLNTGLLLTKNEKLNLLLPTLGRLVIASPKPMVPRFATQLLCFNVCSGMVVCPNMQGSLSDNIMTSRM